MHVARVGAQALALGQGFAHLLVGVGQAVGEPMGFGMGRRAGFWGSLGAGCSAGFGSGFGFRLAQVVDNNAHGTWCFCVPLLYIRPRCAATARAIGSAR